MAFDEIHNGKRKPSVVANDCRLRVISSVAFNEMRNQSKSGRSIIDISFVGTALIARFSSLYGEGK